MEETVLAKESPDIICQGFFMSRCQKKGIGTDSNGNKKYKEENYG
jgi:hypothetical protein